MSGSKKLPEGAVVERWIYLGVEGVGKARVSRWKPEASAGSIVCYDVGRKSLPASAPVGSIYEVTTTRGEGKISVFTSGDNGPRYTRYADDSALRDFALTRRDVDRFLALHLADKARHEAKLAEKKATDDSALEEALDLLSRAYQDARTRGRRTGLLAYMIQRVTGGIQ